MEFLTDFADQAVILPLVGMVGVMLAVLGWWRGALAWALSVGGVLGLLGLLKIVFLACGSQLAGLGIHSPSGHTAAAAVAYGGILLLFGRDRLPRPVLALVPPAIAVLFGVSRVVLHAHVPAEVWLGGIVGVAGAAILLPLAGPQPTLRRWPVAVAAILVVTALHGLRLQAEQMIHAIALLSWVPLPAVCRA